MVNPLLFVSDAQPKKQILPKLTDTKIPSLYKDDNRI